MMKQLQSIHTVCMAMCMLLSTSGVWAEETYLFSNTIPGGAEVTVEYTSHEAVADYGKDVVHGNYFSLPLAPRIRFSGSAQSGSADIFPREHNIGIVKNRDGTFHLALYPGDITKAKRAPRLDQVISLEGTYELTEGEPQPLQIELIPGDADSLLLSVHFGQMLLQGRLH